MLRSLLAGFFALASIAGAAEDPVQWTLTFDAKSAAPGSHVLAKFTGTIEPHWHVYSMTTPPGGPNPTTASIADNPAVAGFKIYQPKPERKLDPSFGIDTETFSGQYVLLFDVELKPDAAPGPGGHHGEGPLPILQRHDLPAAEAENGDGNDHHRSRRPKPGQSRSRQASRWCRRLRPRHPPPRLRLPLPRHRRSPPGFGLFLLTAFAAGLAAIFTPCVFPMIPFTVSYFLNRQTGHKRDGVLQAVVFCLGNRDSVHRIGRAAQSHWRAGSAWCSLGNSPWVNGFIAAVFIVFGLSLLGAYELTLPSGLLTKMNQASEGGGYLGSLLMGLTFTLTSFACIGPFVGPLLGGLGADQRIAAGVWNGGVLQPAWPRRSSCSRCSHRSCKRCPRAAAG